MDGPKRPPPAGLAEADDALASLTSAARHGFVTVVALLERLAPDAVRPGADGPPAREAVRFHHDPRLTFHTADVSRLQRARPSVGLGEDAEPQAAFDVTTTFLGLSGVVSPLPAHMAEAVALEDPERGTLAAFLDVFHHRLLSLLYRLLVKYDYPREYLAGAQDAWSERVLELAGAPSAQDLEAVPRWQILRLAPLLVSHGRNARTLELALTDVLGPALPGARFTVGEFVGAWVALEDQHLVRLGAANSSLGKDFLLGTKLFDRGGKFKITVGPLGQDDVDRLRPGGDLFALLREVVGLVNVDPLTYDLELVLDAGAAPPLALSRTGTTRLGLDSWLGGRKEQETKVVIEVEG
jgi:type VI secretion system protein ImpH